jgi:hypothetical protein
MNFLTEEMVDMVYILGECHGNCLLATRLYKARYPERRQPTKRAVNKLRQRFDANGSVKYVPARKEKRVLTQENELSVLTAVVEDPHRSTSDVSKLLNISETSVRRILKNNKFHAYHIQLHQELNENDFNRRILFCQWMISKLDHEPNFLQYVLFSDEATFHNNGFVNRHNFHYYDNTNPHFTRFIDHQHRWSLNVWGAVLGPYVIGPYFFDGHLNSQMYSDFLNNYFYELLEDVPLHIIANMWLQHDGAPAHSAHRVQEFLNGQFPNRWIGRGGPVLWPPRSPDITPLDFFFGVMLKN